MDFWDWYEKNKWRLFWFKYRMLMGLDPKGQDTLFEENMHFKEMDRLREKALNADNPHDAICNAPVINKQYFLEKWWDKLEYWEKREYLIHTWGNKMDGNLFGFDWWTPYFRDTGFVTNCGEPKPDKPVVLYRGCEPHFRDAISWTDDLEMAQDFASSWLVIGSKFVYGMVVHPEQILGIVKGRAVDINGDPYRSGLEYILEYEKVNTNDIYAINDPKWSEHLSQWGLNENDTLS